MESMEERLTTLERMKSMEEQDPICGARESKVFLHASMSSKVMGL
jgi:hypothetical protein